MTVTLQTLDGLTTAIMQFANRNDTVFISNIPIFVSLTEQELFIKLSTIGNEQYVTGTFTPGNGIIPKPALWGKTTRFTYIDQNGNLQTISRMNVSTINEFNPSVTSPSLGGNPREYSDYGFPYWLVSPTPAFAFNFSIGFFNKIPPLLPTFQTNWYTMNAYDVLFYGCMEKACFFINSSDQQMWAGKYVQGISDYGSYDQTRSGDATTSVEFE